MPPANLSCQPWWFGWSLFSVTAMKTAAAIGAAQPGLQTFSTKTIPEVNQLVSDLRAMTGALASVAEKVDRGGASSLIGSPKLPDYDPKK